MSKLVVRIDADLRDLVPIFIAHKREDAEAIVAAIARADYEALGQLGHRIRGEGGSYGFEELTEIGAALEMTVEAIERVAETTGFRDPERMRRAFIRAFGQPPQSLRRAARVG